MFCDQDGYIWASESGQTLILRDDDTELIPRRLTHFIPDQGVGGRAASIWPDGYRLYDRWSNGQILIDPDIDGWIGSMELHDLNLWDTDAHVADVTVISDAGLVWNHPGTFDDWTTVDITTYIGRDPSALTFSQMDVHGGQLLVTFDYGIPKPVLSVDSSPPDIEIAGTRPGTTPYTSTCEQDEAVTLEAPPMAVIGGLYYAFDLWSIHGVGQPSGERTITVSMESSISVIARYSLSPPADITVTYDDIDRDSGDSISFGTLSPEGGSFRFCIRNDGGQTLILQEAVVQSGGDSISVVGPSDRQLEPGDPPTHADVRVTYAGTRNFSAVLLLPSNDQDEGLFSLTLSGNFTWPIPGDVNFDCKVSVLDLVWIRDAMNQSPSSNGNWRMDVNEDGQINILDMIFIRNHLHQRCDQ